MMTPSELREHEFKGAGRNAYKADDVDSFFGEVAVAYEKLYRENVELVKRISLLADRLEQHKKDEAEIKQAILSAQKAGEIIIREAQAEVEDAKAQAEKIIADAQSDADAIKAEAERQAIADSDLLLSIARDKAEQILKRAKEEAHTIIIEANNSASDTVGAANRTITSESIHFEMLRKEVSDFRASILAQYKTHIELISKLPELAVEEAEKLEDKTEDVAPATEDTPVADEITETEEAEPVFLEFEETDDTVDSTTLTFEGSADEEEETDGEEVVKTTLPYDFFEEDTTIEFVDDDPAEDETEAADSPADDVDIILTSKPESADTSIDYEDDTDSYAEEDAQDDSVDIDETDDTPADIPVSRGFSVDFSRVTAPKTETESTDDSTDSSAYDDDAFSLFESIETIDSDADEDEEEEEKPKKRRRGFFGRK